MIIGKIFTILLKILFQINLSDTQCGFKLYKSNYAKKIFFNLLKIKYNNYDKIQN
jgi:hypothetical protein